MPSDAVWLRFVSGPDIDELRITRREVVDAISEVPLLHPGLVRPGALVVPYGTVSAVAPDLLDVIDKVVVDDWREAQAGRFGALRQQVDSGALSGQTLHAELGAVVSGRVAGRTDPDERILFWHRGLSILDIALGWLILERARRADIGTMLRYH